MAPVSSRLLSRRQAIGLVGLGTIALGTGYAATRYSEAIDVARTRISGRSQIIRTRFGNLEYAVAGQGIPMLMIHGTGGGFDQGLGFAEAVMKLDHRIIAPSRFGYLRSDYPADPSSENQADAFVELLDHLKMDRVPVAGGSAGALSAAQFALRHPDRCSGLILLVPAANVSGRDPVEMSSVQHLMADTLLESDFLFWAFREMAPDSLIGTFLATDPKLLARVSPAERRRAYRILDELMPVSARTKGILNDGRLAGNPARADFSRIRAPTLIISAEDDRFGTASTAREIARVVRNARLVIYPTGGHIWLGRDGAVAAEISRFLHSIPAGCPSAYSCGQRRQGDRARGTGRHEISRYPSLAPGCGRSDFGLLPTGTGAGRRTGDSIRLSGSQCGGSRRATG